jgi:hypothetical protein
MNKIELSITRQWFDSYAHSFAGEDQTLAPLLRLKYDHSFRVERLASRIASELGWSERDISSSRAVAVLHDVGRFRQFADYGTFYDPESADHGDLGEAVLSEEFPWEYLDGHHKSIIREAVKYHNKRIIPDGVQEETLPFLKLVRDADKLDVFTVVREHVEDGRVRELLPRIKPEPEVSRALVEEIEQEGSASYSNVSTLLDFLLVQATWVFDINFSPSLSILKENGTIGWLAESLSVDPASDIIMEKVRARLNSSLDR